MAEHANKAGWASDQHDVLLGLLAYDFVGAAEEVERACHGERVEDAGSAFVALNNPGLLHNGKVLGYRRDIRTDHRGYLTNASRAFAKLVHDKQPGWVGKGLHDAGLYFEALQVALVHIW